VRQVDAGLEHLHLLGEALIQLDHAGDLPQCDPGLPGIRRDHDHLGTLDVIGEQTVRREHRAARVVLSLPRGIEIKPCRGRGPPVGNSRPTICFCHGRSRNGRRAPLPRVTVRYSRANASTRRAPG
jgi:hypothetical protein